MKENRSGAGKKPGYFWSLIEAREEFNGSKAHLPTGFNLHVCCAAIAELEPARSCKPLLLFAEASVRQQAPL